MVEFCSTDQFGMPEHIDPQTLATIEAALEQGLDVHSLTAQDLPPDQARPPGATEALASIGIYTDQEPRSPGDKKEFYAAQDTARQAGRLAANACVSLREVPELKQAEEENQLGSTLRTVFGSIVSVKFEGLHMADVRHKGVKPVEATAAASRTTYEVETYEQRELLASTLRALTRTGTLQHHHYVETGGKDDLTVSITNLNEYTIRILAIALKRIVSNEDVKNGLAASVLPKSRWPLDVSRRAIGETYHPKITKRQDDVQAQYNSLWRQLMSTPEAVSYSDDTPHDSLEKVFKPWVLTSSEVPAWEVTMRVFNTMIRKVRGDGRYNQDQNPNKHKRLLIEDGVRIIREQGKTGQIGPPRYRAQRVIESTSEKTREVVAAQRNSWGWNILKGAGKATSAGAETLIDALAYAIPTWRKHRAKRREDLTAYKAQLAAVEASRSKTLNRIRLVREHFGIHELQ